MPQSQLQHIAGLDCFVVPPTVPDVATTVVVALHGYGANERDLAPLAPYVAPLARWIFPRGPLAIDGLFDGRAWFHLRVEEFMIHAQTGNFNALMNLKFPALGAAASQVDALIRELAGPKQQLVLAGFSQGAILALHTALHYDLPLAGLMLWSPSIVEWSAWGASPRFAKLPPIFISHGQQDSVLPFALTQRLVQELHSKAAEVKFVPFRGEHEIPGEVLHESKAYLLNATKAGAQSLN